jgi:RNA polymerase sigma-70 factor (ECF subfamily)
MKHWELELGLTKQEQWISEVQEDLLGFLYRRCPAQAEELTQEVWLRMTRANPTLATQEEHRRYLFTAARRVLIDHYRTSRRRPILVADGEEKHLRLVSPHITPEQILEGKATARIVEKALSKMKPVVAEVFRLRITTDTTFKEIAARQGVPLNTALGRMHYATKLVRAALTTAGHNSLERS